MTAKSLLDHVRSVKNRHWLANEAAAILLGGALWGCGAAPELDDLSPEVEDEVELGTAEQSITGGVLTGDSFASTVKITQSGQSCSAFKLEGTNKFVTAAHCIISTTGSVSMIADDDGVSGAVTLSIPSGGIQIHPSFTLRNGSNTQDVYDVATITTTTATPAIFGLQIPANEAPPTLPISGTGIGYGCDTTPGSTNGGKRQFGQFDITGSGDHVIRSAGPDAVCSGDSGGPVISNVDGRVLGVTDAAGFGVSIWSRVASIRNWIVNPVPGNDPSLFANSNFLFFMHRKVVSGVPSGLCIAANSNVLNPPSPVAVRLEKCSDPIGNITGKSTGWTSFGTTPSGRFVLLNRGTNLCLQPNGSSTGSVLQAVTCNISSPTANQKWFYERSPGGVLRIKNHSTNLCVSTASGGTSAGTNLVQATCDAGTTADSVLSWVATR